MTFVTTVFVHNPHQDEGTIYAWDDEGRCWSRAMKTYPYVEPSGNSDWYRCKDMDTPTEDQDDT